MDRVQQSELLTSFRLAARHIKKNINNPNKFYEALASDDKDFYEFVFKEFDTSYVKKGQQLNGVGFLLAACIVRDSLKSQSAEELKSVANGGKVPQAILENQSDKLSEYFNNLGLNISASLATIGTDQINHYKREFSCPSAEKITMPLDQESSLEILGKYGIKPAQEAEEEKAQGPQAPANDDVEMEPLPSPRGQRAGQLQDNGDKPVGIGQG